MFGLGGAADECMVRKPVPTNISVPETAYSEVHNGHSWQNI